MNNHTHCHGKKECITRSLKCKLWLKVSLLLLLEVGNTVDGKSVLKHELDDIFSKTADAESDYVEKRKEDHTEVPITDTWRRFFNSDPIPRQIHISLGDDVSEMVVLFVTNTRLEVKPAVIFGVAPNNYSETAFGLTKLFIDQNYDGAHFYHRVKLSKLKPHTRYSYKVVYGSRHGPPYEFNTPDTRDGSQMSFLVYGDMGRVQGSPSLRRLKAEANSMNYTAVIHVGDFAYNLQDMFGVVGDDFMNRIQGVAARVPYMTCPGNHEIIYGLETFVHYRHRFSMPQTEWPIPLDRLWYSINIGKIHFVSYSTEVYFTHEGLFIQKQFDWLKQDLAKANHNRHAQPWVIAFGHRPMYCSNTDKDDCTKPLSLVRLGLEELFYEQGVDVILQGHEHSYERFWPVYNGTVYAKHYSNPKTPVHITCGAAGCNEQSGVCVDPILGERGPWSAYSQWLPGLYGYGRLTVHNDTHLHWEQVLAVNGQVIDSFDIVQNIHGPFAQKSS